MPTVSTMPFLKPHFHNNAGTPATGYKLYSYDSSTQDEIPLYKDPAGTIEYTNPLILNSRGEPDGASIYLDNTKVYKLILKTESDVPVWTETAVQGVNGNGGTSVPVINLPGFTVLGNDTGTYGEAGPIDIANSIAQNTDSRDIPNVGAIVGYTTQFLQNSGDHTYSGNLDVTGNLDVNALTIQGTSINDVFVNEDGHGARTLIGNKDVTDGAVEDIAIKNDLTSNSADEIPSVMAVKSYVDGEVSDLEDHIAAISDSYQVKVSATDNANYLEPKLVSGNRCQITKFTENNEEKLRFDLNIDDLKDISYVFQALSQVAGFDTITNNAVYAGFDSAPVNFGAAFNLTDGKFTALDSGYYHFDVSALISQTGNTNTSICNMWIKHYNEADTELGSVMAFASTPPSAANHPNFTISCAANFHLAISDYVAVVFEIYDAGTLSVNKVAFGGYSLDSANGASASGTPNRLAFYDNNGDLNPAQKLVYDSLYNLLLGTGNSVSTNIAESFVVGDDNAVNAQDAMAIGHQNTIGGGSSSGIAYAVGRQNKVNAPEAMAVGIRNDVGLVSAGETVVFGIENDCDGSEMVCVGQDNDVDGAHSTVLGTDNVATNLSSVVLVGQLNNVSNAYSKTIVGQNLSGASIPYATEVGVGTNTGYLTLFGKFIDQFGGYGIRGRFLGFDADQKLKVTNEVSDVQFMTTAGVTPVEGQLSWNELDKTLNVGLAGGSTLQVGQEEVVYAMNLTGGPILNGEVVYVSGSQGNRVVVSRAQAVTTPTSQVFIAVATQVINDNQMGYFTRFGIVREVNTAAYLEGDILWVSTAAGAMTNSKPNKPYSQIAVAIVTRAHAQQGTIMVSPYVVPRLSQLTDVEVTGATDGQALVYQASTGLWIPGTATGGVSDGKIKVTAGDTADYAGTKFISSDHTVGIEVNSGSIDLTVDVNVTESKFSTMPISTAAVGNLQWGELEFGNWTVAGTDIIAPVSGTHQINMIGKLLYTAEMDNSKAFMGTMSSALFSDISNDIVQWAYCDFGNWNSSKDILTFTEAGKVQLNIYFDIYTSNAVGSNKQTGDISVRHYRSNGSMLRQYTAAACLTGLASQSGYYYDSVNHSEVVDVLVGDYFVTHMTSTGNGYISNVRMNGGMLSNVSNFAGNTTSVQLKHKDSAGTIKSSTVVYEGAYPYAGYRSFAISKVYEIEAGDRFYVNFTPSTNVTAIVDTIVSGAITQTATVSSSGNGGATIDGVQTYAIIASNDAISTGHTSDQGATYTSSRVIPAGVCVANYLSCFATQVGTFYGLRMGIYTPGPAGDTLIAQTANITSISSSGGIITLPLLYDASGNLLASPIELQPNTSYMLAAVIKANACQFLAYTGVSTNPPNHFGRQDGWNAPAPVNLLPTNAGFSQTNTFLWMSASK